MERKWKKNLWTIIGVLAGSILAFTVSAFMVPHGIIMGGATGMGLTYQPRFPDRSVPDYLYRQCDFICAGGCGGW